MPENLKIDYISNISNGDLLIFYGFGIALLVLAIQIKISVRKDKKLDSDIKLAKYAGIYKFIKTIFNWGVFYFVSAVILLLSSICSLDSEILRPMLYNFSFILASLTTLYFTFAYILLVIKDLILTWITAKEFNL